VRVRSPLMGSWGREASFDQRPKRRRRAGRAAGQERQEVKQGLQSRKPRMTVSLNPRWDPSTKQPRKNTCFSATILGLTHRRALL